MSFGEDWTTGYTTTNVRITGYWSTGFRIEFSRFYFRFTLFR